VRRKFKPESNNWSYCWKSLLLGAGFFDAVWIGEPELAASAEQKQQQTNNICSRYVVAILLLCNW